MKKFRTIISIMTAAFSLAAAMPVCSNAIYNVQSTVDFEKRMEELGMSRLDEKYRPIYQFHGKGHYFMSEDGGKVVIAKSTNSHDLFCKFDSALFEGKDMNDCLYIFDDICSALNEKFGVDDAFSTITFDTSLDGEYTYELLFPNDIAPKAVINELKKFPEITGMEYAPERVQIEKLYASHGPAYYYCDDSDSRDKLVGFVEERFPEAEIKFYKFDKEIEETDKAQCLGVSWNGASLENKLDVALAIFNELGISPTSISPSDAKEELCLTIDVDDNVDGDANNDGVFTIADATIILQSLGNPDLYKLSAQGEYNADIYNAGDGVTGLDALEIQKILARK